MKLLLLFFVLILGLSACSSRKHSGQTAAEVLYKEAMELRDDGRYLLALERLGELKSQYPYSYYATAAELLQADIYFSQENYVEAAGAYLLFRDFHPKYKDIAYVVWRVAESYFNQLPSTFDRDLSAAHEAIKYYDELIMKYPSSKYLDGARKKKATAQKMLRDKDQYIADFYFKTDVFDSAKFRYLDIISRYNNRELLEHSMRRVIESSIKLESFSDCVKYSREYQDRVSNPLKESFVDYMNDCQKSFDKLVKSQNS